MDSSAFLITIPPSRPYINDCGIQDLMGKLEVGYGEVRASRDTGMVAHWLLDMVKLKEDGHAAVNNSRIYDRTRN